MTILMSNEWPSSYYYRCAYVPYGASWTLRALQVSQGPKALQEISGPQVSMKQMGIRAYLCFFSLFPPSCSLVGLLYQEGLHG